MEGKINRQMEYLMILGTLHHQGSINGLKIARGSPAHQIIIIITTTIIIAIIIKIIITTTIIIIFFIIITRRERGWRDLE